MILTKEQLMDKIKTIVGDQTDDDTLSFIEDVSDTMDSYADKEDWKAKFEANDKAWREKYRDRFLNGPDADEKQQEPEPDDVDDQSDDEENKPRKFEDLFKEE
jgi:hypothetical protein